MDTGNYDQIPWILTPKKELMRFYRVVAKGTNSGAAPYASILSPTNNAVLSGEIIISVVATSSYPVLNTTLFVDGQEMESSDDGTNYVINTCEWPNGPHILFVTAMAESGLSGQTGVNSTDIGRAVSSYVSVDFDNLIHKVDFSEPFFEPSLGQTQRVTAVFAANVNWTLQVLDESSNAVRTVTGSGTSLSFNWDGTGDGGTNIPDGVYMYLISVETNGLASGSEGGSSGGGGSPPSPNSFLNSSSEPEFYEIPLPPLPLGLSYGTDEEGKEITGMIVPRPARSHTSASVGFSESVEKGGPSPAAYSGGSQSTLAPTKPPTKRVKNLVGTVGVAYYDWSTPRTLAVPKNGLPLSGNSGKVQIQGSYGDRFLPDLPGTDVLVKRFAKKMANAGYKLSFNKSGTNLMAVELKNSSLGGSNLFANVNIGYFSDHGEFGTTIDWHNWAGQSLQTYFPSDNPSDSSAPWIGFSEFGFSGGSLRWIAFDTCFSVHHDQYSSMLNKGVLPIGADNHLFCGATTVTYDVRNLGELWAKKMIGGFFTSPETVSQAWFDAGIDAYRKYSGLSNMVFRVVGWEDCFDDKLKDFVSSPSGSLTYRQRIVYPPPP